MSRRRIKYSRCGIMTTHHSRAATPQGRFQSLGTIYVLNISSHGNRKALTMNRKDFWSNNILKWTWIFNDGRPAQILALTVSIDVQFKASVKMENGRMIWCKKEQWKGFTFSRVLLFYTQKHTIVGGKVGGWTVQWSTANDADSVVELSFFTQLRLPLFWLEPEP